MPLPDDDNDQDPKVLSPDEIKTTFIEEFPPPVEVGGGPGPGGPSGPAGPDEEPGTAPPGSSTDEQPPARIELAVSKFRAMCDELHPPPPGTPFIGKTRKGANAFTEAQADADEHNRKFPGHQAGAVADDD